MKAMSEYHQPLLPDDTYHLFSRAVGSEKLFVASENYRFFLHKFLQHAGPVCELYAYTLLPNHFHLLVKIKDEFSIIRKFEAVKKTSYDASLHHLPDFIMERFSNFLNCYCKSFNKVYNRKGGLFIDYMKRSLVKRESDFTSFLWYIHKNAVHHGLVLKVGQWPYDSYKVLTGEAPTELLRDEVIDWFGSKEVFKRFHQQRICPKKYEGILDL